jgi:tungstate transport system ATP-binding protein
MRDFAQASAHNLSGGETQRVAIARALACSPKVILFDEPTSNVDVENQIIIERVLRDINSQKAISVIFATHNRMQAATLSDHILFLFKGKPASSVYENIFSASIREDNRGDRYCLVHEKVILPVETDKSGEVTISIDPRMAKVLPAQDSLTDDNGFVGRVVQLTDEGGDVRALIDIGIPISVLLRRDTYRKAPVLTGDRVLVICPPQSIEIV